MKSKKNLIISIVLILISIIYTILVKNIDVRAIGPNESLVGFGALNSVVHNAIGVNMSFYKITELLGLIPICMVLIYGLIGFMQLIKRKSLLKIDKEIIALGVLYVVVALIYVFFEKVIINYRPTLIDGVLEASYPSSHTLLAICVCASSLMVNKYIFKENKYIKIWNVISILLIILIVGGRIISGVHWASDIIGSMLISSALLMSFYTYLNKN